MLLFGLPTGSVLAQRPKAETKSLSDALRLQVSPAVPLPVEGKVNFLFASAAPDDPDRLLACATEHDDLRGRFPSAVYASLDAGNTWMRVLVDASSDLLSELSCVAGTNGRAYFVTSASETSRPFSRHELGSMEAFRSLDGGLNWTGPRRYPFVDLPALAVTNTGDQTEKVYLFGNNFARGWGDAGNGSWRGRAMMAVSEDGLDFSEPSFPVGGTDPTLNYFPSNALALKDSCILALFRSGNRHLLFKSDDKGYRQLSEIELPPEMHKANLGNMAVDYSERFPNRLYDGFSVEEKNRAILGIAISDNEGVTWRFRTLLERNIAGQEGGSTAPRVAVNSDGVLGIVSGIGECFVFAVSVDGGESVSKTASVGTCGKGQDGEYLPSPQSYLWYQEGKLPGVSFVIDPSIYGGGPEIVADAGGRFHLFWTERTSDGNLVFLTSTITISTSGTKSSYQVDLNKAEDLTKSTVIKVNNVHFDSVTATFDADLSVRNAEATKEIAYPSFLEVSSEHSGCGKVIYLNPFLTAESGKAIFRIPRASGNFQLLPGNRTLPVHFRVRVTGCEFNNLGQLLTLVRSHHIPDPPTALSALQIGFRVLALPASK